MNKLLMVLAVIFLLAGCDDSPDFDIKTLPTKNKVCNITQIGSSGSRYLRRIECEYEDETHVFYSLVDGFGAGLSGVIIKSK